ncbi:MAG: polysaccharide biosynthesis tyrosine autokinase [Muribaculaceae bacterium]|nr:polysaccharide biosynthesis tyrosine autokinase [Muribaculaceae bacterium]
MSTDTLQKNDIKTKDESFDITGLLLDYLKHWYWFLICVIITTGLAYYYSSTIIPTYQVSASVYLNDESAANGKAVNFSSTDPMVNLKTFIDETEIEILKSRNNLIKIVDSLKMSYSYYYVGKLRDIPTYRSSVLEASMDSTSLNDLDNPITLTISQEDNKFNVKAETRTDGEEIVQESTFDRLPAQIKLPSGVVTLSQAGKTSQMTQAEKIVISNPRTVAANLSANLSIEFPKNSNSILRINLNTPIIEQGRDVINTLITFYNRKIIEDKNRSAIQTEAFIIDRLRMIQGELGDVEEKLKTYREQHNISDKDAQIATNLSQQSQAEIQTSQLDAQIDILSDVETQVKSQDKFSTLPNVVDDPGVKAEIEAYNTLVNRYNALSEVQTEETDIVKESKQRLNEQRNLVLSNIRSAKNSLRQHRSSVASVGGRSASQLSAQPKIDKGLQDIFREQSVKNDIYTFLLEKREEIAIQKTLATPTAQLIDNPMGSGPVSPKRYLILAIGVLIGLLIPGLLLLIKRCLSPKFNDQEELERVTSVPILGEICLDKSEDPIVVGDKVATPIAELFRLMRNNINFTSQGRNRMVIMLTSTISGEGKTFIALNLAMTYALTNKKVCVVGLDIRRPVLAHTCGLTNQRGVTTFLSGQEKDLNSLIHQSSFDDNLYVLPAGPIPPNPNELLMSDNMKEMFKQLREQFDYIIVDTSPIGMISDTHLVTPHTDIQIYVARAGYTTRKSLKVLHQAISQNRLPKAYIILNGVNMNSNTYIYRRYGHYAYNAKHTYGYGYGYGKTPHKRRLSDIFKRRKHQH